MSTSRRTRHSLHPLSNVPGPPTGTIPKMAASPRLMTVGCVGLGQMGEGMARCLLSRGFPVTILGNRRRDPVDRLVSRGATEAASPSALAAASSTIVLCLPCSGTVESLVAELKPSLVAERHTIIDTGTSSLESTAALSAALGALGVGFAEAPLTGGKAQAREGVLGALVGCDTATFTRVEPVLSAFCSTVEHFGGVGAGGRAKLINNGMVIGIAALVIEAFRKVGGWY